MARIPLYDAGLPVLHRTGHSWRHSRGELWSSVISSHPVTPNQVLWLQLWVLHCLPWAPLGWAHPQLQPVTLFPHLSHHIPAVCWCLPQTLSSQKAKPVSKVTLTLSLAPDGHTRDTQRRGGGKEAYARIECQSQGHTFETMQHAAQMSSDDCSWWLNWGSHWLMGWSAKAKRVPLWSTRAARTLPVPTSTPT